MELYDMVTLFRFIRILYPHSADFGGQLSPKYIISLNIEGYTTTYVGVLYMI